MAPTPDVPTPIARTSEDGPIPRRSAFARYWDLDPDVTFLNHGSFGACPRSVLDAQAQWRRRLEAEPVRFLDRDLEEHLDAARTVVASFVGARPADMAFVPNATTAASSVLASVRFEPRDELLATDHEYNATLNALRAAAARNGARVVVAHVPFPIASAAEATDAILGAVSDRTRFALVSHITSSTALVLPIHEIVRELEGRGVAVLVDGAHGPGQVALDLDDLGASYYAGNGHKWLCGPKGSGFLHVRDDRRASIHPVVISHGANSSRGDRSRFHLEFDWPGTVDPTPYLALPDAIQFMASLLPGGWPAVMAANRALARRARDILCAALGIEPPAPDELLGAMAAVPLAALPSAALPSEGAGARWAGDPVATDRTGARSSRDPLATELFERYRIEVPIGPWPVPAALDDNRAPDARLLRVSAQLYDDESEYQALASALRALL